ncbi:DUF4266 domain-containing protein, partial [Acinetobacter baumannii]
RSPFPPVLSLLCALAVILPLAGCAAQPVQPWQRGTLAGPAMAWDAEPMRASQQRQIENSKEAASGGSALAGGGCGCN